MDLFDHLKNICYGKKDLTDEELKSYDPFMISRYVSMSEIYLPTVSELNQQKDISKRDHFRFFLTVLPKRETFFPYIKKVKERNEEEISCLSKYLEISHKEAKKYIERLDPKMIKEIVSRYVE